MIRNLIRYTLKPEHVAENERLVRAVFEALQRTRPEGLSYATFRLDDGVSFVHVVSYDSAERRPLLTALPAFEAFVSGIRERCATAPLTTPLNEVGMYGFDKREA